MENDLNFYLDLPNDHFPKEWKGPIYRHCKRIVKDNLKKQLVELVVYSNIPPVIWQRYLLWKALFFTLKEKEVNLFYHIANGSMESLLIFKFFEQKLLDVPLQTIQLRLRTIHNLINETKKLKWQTYKHLKLNLALYRNVRHFNNPVKEQSYLTFSYSEGKRKLLPPLQEVHLEDPYMIEVKLRIDKIYDSLILDGTGIYSQLLTKEAEES